MYNYKHFRFLVKKHLQIAKPEKELSRIFSAQNKEERKKQKEVCGQRIRLT